MTMPVYAGDTIRFVYYNDNAPFGWEENGEMQGIYIDIVNEVFKKRLGIPVEHRGYPWKRAQMMVKNGDADGYCRYLHLLTVLNLINSKGSGTLPGLRGLSWWTIWEADGHSRIWRKQTWIYTG